MVLTHEPISTGTHILLNPTVRASTPPSPQRLTKPLFSDPVKSSEDLRYTLSPLHNGIVRSTPSVNEPTLVSNENTAEMYKTLYQQQVQRIQSMEKELETLRNEKKDLQTTLDRLNDLLQQKEHRSIVHPFHKFRTALDDYAEIPESRTEIVESDDEEEEDDEPYMVESMPEYSPPRKRRRESRTEHHFGEEYFEEAEKRKKPSKKPQVKRFISRHASLQTGNSSDEDCPVEPPPELPENTGVLDLTRIVTWQNELYALSKAFPYKHRLQVMTKRYEAEKQKPAYILLEADDLRLLKKHYENVGQKSRQVALYTKDFMQYFVENEDYEAH